MKKNNKTPHKLPVYFHAVSFQLLIVKNAVQKLQEDLNELEKELKGDE